MTPDNLLSRLDAFKTSFSTPDAAHLARLLHQVPALRIDDPSALIRLHETLLFLRAYPSSPAIARKTEIILRDFRQHVLRLSDTLSLEEPEISGIVGTGITAVFSRDVARYLVAAHPRRVSIHWEAWETPQRLGLVLPGLLPLINDDAAVEAHVPFRDWLDAAGGLPWLAQHAHRWDELEIPLRLEFDAPSTRTLMRLATRKLFIHSQPLIPRRDISITAAASEPPFAMRRLSPAGGQRMIDLARDTSAVRYRELHGFTYGDQDYVYEIDAGRGVLLYVWGVKPDHRLPLRSYHAATMWKNGVPVGYFEGLTLAERMEAGFNLYYTFREGETAWLYSCLLKLFYQWLGVRTISLDTYQIGHQNQEAIDSGAFWFYRKLGFRSTSSAIRDLTAREEQRISKRPGYRSPASTLRKLVVAPMVYEFPDAEMGAWDNFETRRIGLAAVRKTRGVAMPDWDALAAIIPGFNRWTPSERRAFNRVRQAKQAAEEVHHLHLLQKHSKLRRALIDSGSR